MARYIELDALVAEIDRRIKHYNLAAKEFGDEGYKDNVLMEQCKANACEHILSFLDSLEVDFDKEWQEYFKYRGNVATVNIKEFAKHFYSLGLKAQKG